MNLLTDKQLELIAQEEEFLLFCDMDEFKQIARHIEAIVCRELHQQLSDHIKREVMLRDALHAIAIEIATENLSAITVLKKCFRMADEALTATADLDGLILCENNPVGFYLNREEFFDDWYSSVQLSEKWEPLYRAWKLK